MTDKLRKALAALPALNPGRCYLCIGPNVWGKAFSAEQAWENAQKPKSWLMLDAPPCATVDGMGAICWYPTLYADGDAGIERTDTGSRPFGIGSEAKQIGSFGIKRKD